MDSPNMTLVKEAFRASTEDGLEAGVEHLLSRAHETTEFRPYVADGRVLRGPDEVRAFFSQELTEGRTLTARPAGGLAEAQVKWVYRFRDGRLEEASWVPANGT